MLTKITNLFFILALIPCLAFAGQNIGSKETIKSPKTSGYDEMETIKLLGNVPNPVLRKASTVPGTRVGYTYYDYMTNGAVGERLLNFGDGTFMVGTMAAIDLTGSTTTRGTYYNYFDGTNWLDTAIIWKRIELVRRGWGTIGAFGTAKAGVIASHTGINVAVNAGTATDPVWNNQVVPPSKTWPKIAADDGGTGNYYGIYITIGDATPSTFWLSLDGGTNWTVKDLVDTAGTRWKEGYNAPGADDYMVAAKNEKVAVTSFVTGKDVTLFLSTDNGSNFTTTTLFDAMALDASLPSIPFDTSFFPASTYKMLGMSYPDGTGDVHIDNSGNVHVAWGTYELGYRILVDTLGQPIRDTLGNLQRSFFTTDWASTGIKYWKTGMANPVTAVVPNSTMMDPSLRTFSSTTGVPTTINTGLDMSLIGIPSIGTDATGNVFMTFQGFKANDTLTLAGDVAPSPFGHVYAIGSVNGTTWSAPIDIYGSSLMGEDVLYASLADLVDSKLHILIQNDASPGTWLQQSNHPQNLNYFIYTTLNKGDVLSVGDDNPIVKSFKLDQNYPNPFNPSTKISFTVANAGYTTLKIYNLIGKEVATLFNGSAEAGRQYIVNFDAKNLSSGMYFYKLQSGNNVEVKKLTLLK